MKTKRKVAALFGIGVAVALTAGSAFGVGAAGPREQAQSQSSALQILSQLQSNIRTLDGSNNNPRHADWGQAGRPYTRIAKTNYSDGASGVPDGPNARYISNRVFNDEGQNIFSENGVTQWGFTWGQLLDHSFGLAANGGADAPIPFDGTAPLEEFTNDFGSIMFSRDAAAPGTGVTTPRQQINTVSSFIDAWAVYGGANDRLEWMRQGPVDGNMANNKALMLTTADGYLPRADARGNASTAPTMALMGGLMGAPQTRIIAGDVRANENIALTAVQTLLVREHNRIVNDLPAILPEQLKFEIARKIVGAEEQYILYHEFLPAVGVRLPAYHGYDSRVDPRLTNEFATVGYRAHSMIHGEFEIEVDAGHFSAAQLQNFEDQGIEVEAEGDEVALVIPLNVALGNPSLVPEIGLGPILAGIGSESEYKNDEQIDNQLRSVMFQVPKPGIQDPSVCLDGPNLPDCYNGVLDLGAIDVQRGRDHGTPSYNDLRAAYGLPRKTSFAAITGEATDAFPLDPEINASDPINDPDILDFVELRDAAGNLLTPGTDAAANTTIKGVRRTPLAARLKAIYGDVNKVDAFVGMVSEKHVRGSEFGELQLAMWKTQFQALRDGDRFFYDNDPTLSLINRYFGISYKHTLSDLIKMNTDADPADVPADVFHVAPPSVRSNIGAPLQRMATARLQTTSMDSPISDVPVAALSDDRRRGTPGWWRMA